MHSGMHKMQPDVISPLPCSPNRKEPKHLRLSPDCEAAPPALGDNLLCRARSVGICPPRGSWLRSADQNLKKRTGLKKRALKPQDLQNSRPGQGPQHRNGVLAHAFHLSFRFSSPARALPYVCFGYGCCFGTVAGMGEKKQKRCELPLLESKVGE